MILVDTSVWIDHFRAGDEALSRLLNGNRVFGHPFVAGELACGNLRNRTEVLDLLSRLPRPPIASHEEVLIFINGNELMGRGIGYVDAHILAAAAMVGRPCIWTRDKRLGRVAAELDLARRH